MGVFSGSVGLRFDGCKSFNHLLFTHPYPLPTIRPNVNVDLVILLQKADGASVDQSKALYDQAIAQNPRNLLPLNHETHDTTAHDLLPYIINLFQSQGYQLVTLAECLNLPAYQQETEPGVPNVSSFYMPFCVLMR